MKKLNFACGNDIRDGWDNCDWQETNRKAITHTHRETLKGKGVIFCDANKFPYSFKDNVYDYILLRQCLTLFDNPRKVLVELHRISKNKAIIHIEVAHYSNKGAYTDLDTKHWFNEQSFVKFIEHNCRINEKNIFELIELKLITERKSDGSLFEPTQYFRLTPSGHKLCEFITKYE